MTKFHDVRAQIRDTGYQPAPSGAGLPFWIVTACAVAVGFTVVLFAPRFYTVQRTAALPTFKDMLGRADSGSDGQGPAITRDAAPGNAARYVGKCPDEMARIADAVCLQRPASRAMSPSPNSAEQKPSSQAKTNQAMEAFASGGSVADENDRLHCQLTEAPARYCAPSQRQKITADVINYFRAIENMNASMQLALKIQQTVGPDRNRLSQDPEAALGKFAVDPRVIEGVEGLIRAGYLLKPQREDIGASGAF